MRKLEETIMRDMYDRDDWGIVGGFWDLPPNDPGERKDFPGPEEDIIHVPQIFPGEFHRKKYRRFKYLGPSPYEQNKEPWKPDYDFHEDY